MKLLRFGEVGSEKPGVLDNDGNIRDLSSVVNDISPAEIANIDKLKSVNIDDLPVVDGDPRIGVFTNQIGKFILIGLNYTDHAEELDKPIPEKPIVLLKATSAVCGPNDDVEIPSASEKPDWEVELAIVIGKEGKNIDPSKAMDYVAGYTMVNDITDRHFLTGLNGGQWTLAKSFDTFAPTGPYFVTKDEVPNPNNLKLSLSLNGEVKQNGTTANMIFDVPKLVSYVSEYMSLQPGDIISTGTPGGIGLAQNPPRFIQAGDVMELSIEGFGKQKQTCK